MEDAAILAQGGRVVLLSVPPLALTNGPVPITLVDRVMLLSIAYADPVDLIAADESQFRHGGVLVPVEPPAGLNLYEHVELEISTEFAGTIRVAGQVVQLVPGAGVAVTFEAAAVRPLVEVARSVTSGSSPPAPPWRSPD